ncbi:hypothetical protein QCA50_012350 [Cerrena zonata]|uniref:Uncharacterized protein n=1 Tax=Cerrena zonata TaxID=2478898 RepID=A0AAW0FTN4_9APHY
MATSHTSAPSLSGMQWDDRKLDVKFNDVALYCTEAQREAIRKIHGPNGCRVHQQNNSALVNTFAA